MPGLPRELLDLRLKLQEQTANPYDGSLATALLSMIEACQEVDRQAARQQEIAEFSDARLRVSELYQAREHLAAAGREILDTCRLAFPPPVPLPAQVPHQELPRPHRSRNTRSKSRWLAFPRM